MSLTNIFFENEIKKGACLRDMMGQTYPICACSDTNHARHFIGSQYVLLQLKTMVFKVTLEKFAR